jgi:type I restriction enzyme, S subunit
MSYEQVLMGDIAEIIMGQSPPGDTYNESDVGLPFYQGTTDFGSRYPARRVFCSAPSRIARSGDILFSVRAPIGRVNIATETCAIGRGLAVIRAKQQDDQSFLEFALREKSNEWNILESQGSVFGNAKKNDLWGLKINWPCKNERFFIAHILGTLDDKIELNCQMNQTLEAMAKAIFKSWFVDFDPVRAKMEGRQPEGMDVATAELFPDSFEDSALGLIPKGWKIGTIETECDLTMGQSPKSEFYNTNGEGLPFHQGVANFEKRFPIHRIFCKVSHRIAHKGDILLSVRAPVGRINIANTEMVIGRGLSAIRHKRNYQSTLFYQLQNFFKEEDCIGTGTVYAAVTKQEIQSIRLLVPSKNLGHFFDTKIKSMDNIILNNVIQSRTLAHLRDSLLPKLMSGEIRVKEAERVINDIVQM